MILHVRLSTTRRLVIRARYSLILLWFIMIICFMVVSSPLPILVGVGLAFLLSVLAGGAFCGAASEVLCNRNRLVIVTPFRCHTYAVRSLDKIINVRIPSSFFFMFIVTTKTGKKKFYHFVALDSSVGSYVDTANKLRELFERLNDKAVNTDA